MSGDSVNSVGKVGAAQAQQKRKVSFDDTKNTGKVFQHVEGEIEARKQDPQDSAVKRFGDFEVGKVKVGKWEEVSSDGDDSPGTKAAGYDEEALDERLREAHRARIDREKETATLRDDKHAIVEKKPPPFQLKSMSQITDALKAGQDARPTLLARITAQKAAKLAAEKGSAVSTNGSS